MDAREGIQAEAVAAQSLQHFSLPYLRLQAADFPIAALDLPCLGIDPAHKAHLAVENEVAFGLAPGDKERGLGHLVGYTARGAHHRPVGPIEGVEIEIAQYVDVVDEDGR